VENGFSLRNKERRLRQWQQRREEGGFPGGDTRSRRTGRGGSRTAGDWREFH